MLLVSTTAAMLVRLFARYVERSTGAAKAKVDPVLRFYLVSATDVEYRRLTGEVNRLLYEAAKAGAGAPKRRRRRRVFCVAAVPESE